MAPKEEQAYNMPLLCAILCGMCAHDLVLHVSAPLTSQQSQPLPTIHHFSGDLVKRRAADRNPQVRQLRERTEQCREAQVRQASALCCLLWRVCYDEAAPSRLIFSVDSRYIRAGVSPPPGPLTAPTVLLASGTLYGSPRGVPDLA